MSGIPCSVRELHPGPFTKAWESTWGEEGEGASPKCLTDSRLVGNGDWPEVVLGAPWALGLPVSPWAWASCSCRSGTPAPVSFCGGFPPGTKHRTRSFTPGQYVHAHTMVLRCSTASGRVPVLVTLPLLLMGAAALTLRGKPQKENTRNASIGARRPGRRGERVTSTCHRWLLGRRCA